MKRAFVRYVRQQLIPLGAIADDSNVSPVPLHQWILAATKSLPNDWNAFRIKAHKVSTSCIDAGGMNAKHHDSRGHGVGVRRSASLAGNDAVDKHVMPLTVLGRRRTKRPISFAVHYELVQVEAHSPDSIVAPPVAAADHFLGIAEYVRSDALCPAMKPPSDAGKRQRQ